MKGRCTCEAREPLKRCLASTSDRRGLHNRFLAAVELQAPALSLVSSPNPLQRSPPAHTSTMLSRTLRARSTARALPRILRASYSDVPQQSVNQVPANDPNPKPPKPNVSATNAVPTSSEGSFDQVLQESAEKGEELRVMQAPNRQAPNRKGIWSRSQQPREIAMSGPRFEQTIFEDQVCDVRSIGYSRYVETSQ